MKLPTLSAQPARWIAILFVATLISACETTGRFSLPGGSAEARAARLADLGQHADSASSYIGLATEKTGPERDRLTLLAVEQWIEADDLARARNAVGTVEPQTSGPLLALWTSATAGLMIEEGQTDRAIEMLESLSLQTMPLGDRLRVESRRADAWFSKGEPARAIELLTQRETWLDDGNSVLRNREKVWDGLVASNPAILRAAAKSATDSSIRGWLSLGSLAATTGQQGIGWSNGVVRWQERNPGHPAIVVLESLDIGEEILLDYPRQIALLLPLSGQAASAGKAIQNGFLGAYFSNAGGLDDRQSVRIYDVDAEGGAVAAYESAVEDGAEFVVGPLLRNSAAQLANDILVPVPVLTLNYLPDDTLAPPGLFQFALAPEDEAVAAAERAIEDGYARAVALVPNSGWGRRVLQAFVSHFEFLGGTTLDYRMYSAGNPDYSGTIEDLMALSGSVRRYTRLRANLGGPLQFDPRRRQDAQFIFLAADAPAGRLLKSQLKFHYSGDLQVYATSSINAMDGRSNADLNDILFADAPWVIGSQHWTAYLPPLFNEFWPEQRRLGRLQAMGYDAYQLVAPLYANRSGTMPKLDGATGTLRLDSDGRVRRELPWARFVSGEAIPQPKNELPEATDIPLDDTVPGDDPNWQAPVRQL